MKAERFLVTIINNDDTVFTYGVVTVGGRSNAMDIVKMRITKNTQYFIHARISDEKADYEILPEANINIPNWVNNF